MNVEVVEEEGAGEASPRARLAAPKWAQRQLQARPRARLAAPPWARRQLQARPRARSDRAVETLGPRQTYLHTNRLCE